MATPQVTGISEIDSLEQQIKEKKKELNNIEIPDLEVDPIREDRTEKQSGHGTSRFQINERQEVNITGKISGHQSKMWFIRTTSHTGKGEVYKESGQVIVEASADGSSTSRINSQEVLDEGTYIIRIQGEHRNATGNIEVEYYIRDYGAEDQKEREIKNIRKNRMEKKERLQAEINDLENQLRQAKISRDGFGLTAVREDPDIGFADLVVEYKLQFGMISLLSLFAFLYYVVWN